jgi:competence protein ComEA
MWKFIKDYLTFSRTEIRVILILSGLLLASLIFRISLKFIPETVNEITDEEIHIIEEFVASLEFKEKETRKDIIPRTEIYFDNLEEFDPNLVTARDLKIMGFPDIIISNLSKYRMSGGRFIKKDEFRKIYGLSDSAFNIIAPYIKIVNLSRKDKNLSDTFTVIVKEKKIINLNTADSTQLVTLKGIGPGFASRIIKYRKRLGGFILPEQVLEVFGMDSTRYDMFKNTVFVDTTGLIKIDLNRVTFSGLARHPYIDEKSAASIIKYREYRKEIKDIDELSLYNIIQEEKLKRIEPYLVISKE